MSKEEMKTEKPHKILEIVIEILDFNKKNKKITEGFRTKNTNTKPNA